MDKIISIREARQRRSPDTMLELAMSDPGHIARRQARRDAYWQRLELERQEMDEMRLRAAERELLAVKALVGGMAISFLACLVALL